MKKILTTKIYNPLHMSAYLFLGIGIGSLAIDKDPAFYFCLFFVLFAFAELLPSK